MNQYRSRKAGEQILRTYDALLSQWGVPFQETDVPTRYGQTHAVIAGPEDAKPLVLFHGVGDDSALMWIYNAAALAKKMRIYAIDTIGGPGKSRMGPGYDKTFDDVTWIDETLDGLSIPVASIAGVSHGGYLAQLYTLERPERVDKTICIAASVPSGTGSPIKNMMRIFLPEALFPTDKNVVRLLRKMSGDHPQAFTDNPLVLEHFRWLMKGFNNMAMAYHNRNLRAFTEAEIDAIRPRVRYLLGEKDPFQTLGGREAMLSHRMNARFYPDAGHGLNHELAGEINEALLDILNGNG